MKKLKILFISVKKTSNGKVKKSKNQREPQWAEIAGIGCYEERCKEKSFKKLSSFLSFFLNIFI